MYTGGRFLKKQNKSQSNGRGRRRARRKGAVGEESTRQLREEQTLLWGWCTSRLLWGFLSCLQAVEDVQEKSGDQKGLDKSRRSASFITKHTLLVWDEKQTLGAQPAVCTSGGSIRTGLSLQPRKRLFSGLLFKVSSYFHRKDKCAVEVGLSKWLGKAASLGWQTSLRVSETSADQPWSRQALWVALCLRGDAGAAGRSALPAGCSTGRCSDAAPGWLDAHLHHPGDALCLEANRRGCYATTGGV